MARDRWWILVVGIGMMGGIVVWRYVRQPMASYTVFTSTHLHVRFQYPEGWKVQEVREPGGTTMGEVQIFGPRREDIEYSLYVDVAAQHVSGNAATPDQAVEAALAQRRKQRSYKLLEKTPIRCAGEPATRVLASYELLLPLTSANRRPVAFHELVAYCLHDGRLFRLTFAAPVEDFERHQHAFNRLVKSFTFLP